MIIKNRKIDLYGERGDERELYDEESAGLLIEDDKTDNELIKDIHNLSQSTLSKANAIASTLYSDTERLFRGKDVMKNIRSSMIHGQTYINRISRKAITDKAYLILVIAILAMVDLYLIYNKLLYHIIP